MKLPPRLSGVCQIRCVSNGKIYVGSSVDVRGRWLRHRFELNRGTHGNCYLQKAWNRQGEAGFDIVILELAEPADLLKVEQKWIDQTRCADRKIGFNISPIAGSTGSLHAQIWKGFIDPDGREITIFNLHEFCRRHRLDPASMQRLASGKSKLKSYKGWTHKNSVRQRDYVKTYDGFIAPDGRRVGPITNLAAFCREHGLDKTHMLAVIRGRICSHRGWTHENGRQRQEKIHTGFVSPDGQQVRITNLQAFCREHGLHPVHMHQVKNGERKSHKGWTWKENHA
jgi:group I intron endonuclease